MATATNKCGLSLKDTLDIIKDKVITGGYNGKSDVMNGLLGYGYSYSEAKQVADYYYSVYNRIAQKNKVKKPNVILSPAQRVQKKVQNLAINFLTGDTGGFPMDASAEAELERIFEKVNSAETPTLKAKFEEEAKVHMARFLPGYTDELFKSSVYARPLLSAVFFIKSVTSNIHAQVERYITNVWDGGKLDFTQLWKFSNLSDTTAFNVMKGGVPATNLYQNETTQHAGARLEEYTLDGTPAKSNPVKGTYFAVMKYMSRLSNRLNAAPDSWGIFANTERHLYDLLKEKYRNEGLSHDDAKQKALEDMALDDEAKCIQMAEKKFTELGLPIRNKGGKYTPEFKVAVAEYQRLKRDGDMWERALTLSKNDFWKRNMTSKSELGFGDYGLFGLKAQVFAKLRETVEGRGKKNKATSAFNLFAFGFINGAANFAEDALERMPIYGLVKLAFLQHTKKNTTDEQLASDVRRRQRDIIVKNLATFAFFMAAKYVERAICGEKSGKASVDDLSNNRTQIGVCGIPFLVPPQMMVMLKVYRLMDAAMETDEEFFDTVTNMLGVLSQNNEMGLGGSMDKVIDHSTKYAIAKGRGDKAGATEELAKVSKSVVDAGTAYANSFIPLPSRGLNEVATFAQRAQGMTQKQQQLPFLIDEVGKPKGVWQSIGGVTLHSLGNVTGVGEIISAAVGSKKPYAMDWQGRKVVQFRGSDIFGSGIKYNANDDILREAGVMTPYVNRLQKVEGAVLKDKDKAYHGGKIKTTNKEIRYLTDDEYFNVSDALGRYRREHFEEYADEMVAEIKEDKEKARKNITAVFDGAKDKAIEAVSNGITDAEGIYNYVNKQFKFKKTKSRTTKSTD